jgi:hypothetical protein
VLAGAPQLVDRWEHATDPYAKAVMTAAIDCRRLGHLAPLPAQLLGAAVPGYLTPRQHATAAPDWFTTAIAFATRELHGATSALIPVPGLRMGEVAGYEVADYLLQHGQTTRRAIPPPGSVWDSLAAHTRRPEDRIRLAGSALSRNLRWHGVHLATPAAEAGDTEAMRILTILYWSAGHRDAMHEWIGRAIDADDPGVLAQAASVLEEAGELQEAEELLRELAADGHSEGMWGLARLLDRAGREQEAEALLRQLVKEGDSAALWELVDRLHQRGRGLKAEGWLRRMAETGDVSAMGELAQLLEWTGREEEAESWLRRAAERGDCEAMLDLARLLEWMGHNQEVEGWLRRAAEGGDFNVFSRMRLQCGRDQRLEGWLRHAAEGGNGEAMRELARLLEHSGRSQEAEGWLRRAAEAETLGAARELVRLLEHGGRSQEAEDWMRPAAETGNGEAMGELARLLEQSGRDQEAEGWLRRARELGISTGGRGGKSILARLLERTGRGQEADRLRRFGIVPGGRIADPW